jgi:spermidine/putrescine-binding protein
MNKHIGRWIIGGIIGAAGLALVAVTPAMAATSADATVIWPASSYTAPSSGAIAIKAFAGGEQLEALCFVNGAYTNGSNVWLRVAIADGGGWIARSAVDVAPIPPC